MPIRSVAAALVATTIFSPLARAEEGAPPARASTARTAICAEAPRDQFRPEAQLRSVIEATFRYRIARIGVDAGCYSVLASDRHGTPFEVRFRGSDLRMVSRYVVRDVPLDAASSDQ